MEQWLRANADAAARTVEAFCEASQRLSKAGVFPAPPRLRDAASFLSVRSGWEGQPGRSGLIDLPPQVLERLRDVPEGKVYFDIAAPQDWAGLDFGWMNELLAYDSWSLSADGPLRDADLLDIESSIPNFLLLQHWVKLRLAKAIATGGLPEASREVRHLADLIASTGTLIGEMIRISILGLDRLAWERSGIPIPESLVSPNQREDMRRLALSAPFYLAPGVARSVKEKALACAATRCSMVQEALAQNVAVGTFVPGSHQEIDWLTQQGLGLCDPVLVAKLARGRPMPMQALAEFLGTARGIQLQLPLPPDAGL